MGDEYSRVACFFFLFFPTVMAVWKNGVKNPLKKRKWEEKLFSFINAKLLKIVVVVGKFHPQYNATPTAEEKLKKCIYKIKKRKESSILRLKKVLCVWGMRVGGWFFFFCKEKLKGTAGIAGG